MYLLSSSECNHPIQSQDYSIPSNYLELKIKGKLLTSFTRGKPITILNQGNRTIIQHGLLLEQVHMDSEQFSSEEVKREYIIAIPSQSVKQILRNANLKILPYGKNFNHKKGVSYEIFI